MGFGLGYVAYVSVRFDNDSPLIFVLRVAWVSVASYYAKNETLAWRLPLALACVGPLGLLAGIYFVPGWFCYAVVGPLLRHGMQNRHDTFVGSVRTEKHYE